jgi:steroid delta-isomerase-like uncharacterized protein
MRAVSIARRGLLGVGGAMALFPSGRASASAGDMRGEQLIRRYFEVWNTGVLEPLDELLSSAYINHTPSTPNPPRGPEGLKPIIVAMRTAFPDLHYRIEDIVATPDRAVARVVMTGTHRGAFFGFPATGRPVRVNQINIEQIDRQGRIAEHWRVTDELTLMRQLGQAG